MSEKDAVSQFDRQDRRQHHAKVLIIKRAGVAKLADAQDLKVEAAGFAKRLTSLDYQVQPAE